MISKDEMIDQQDKIISSQRKMIMHLKDELKGLRDQPLFLITSREIHKKEIQYKNSIGELVTASVIEIK